ncbi:hypothetical protein HH308_03305 [Gordonia sp. TBRC 11910]|uniref:Uncharacterized protein n=1 Tax=Gordonia asplenii TaxID=2725283 RepID=A0A848KQC6_9ACTN|nr:hypothetical protein [Gordonia asplenii]NMO00239.1 hypothetical protein [Gordonia asplenii]
MATPDRHDIEHGSSVPDAADSPWGAAAGWLRGCIDDIPLAGVLDVGPHHVRVGDSYDVHCAQIQRLERGRLLLRLSTMLMIIPLLDGYDAPDARLDCWYHDDLFEDCTHGYLISMSSSMVADLVMAWFRDRGGFVSPDELGYCTTVAKQLPGG